MPDPEAVRIQEATIARWKVGYDIALANFLL